MRAFRRRRGDLPLEPTAPQPFFGDNQPADARATAVRRRTGCKYIGELRLPDSLLSALPLGNAVRRPTLPERFLPPPRFVWGRYLAADGAVLRWGHLPVA